VDGERSSGADSWLSIWVRHCPDPAGLLEETLRGAGVRLETEILRRHPASGRFAENPVLRHLEENWAQPVPFADDECTSAGLRNSLRAAVCANPESEAVLAAREILHFVHAGGRFRETAVLLRTLEGYHDVLRRVFSRYGIPFFLDRREPSAIIRWPS